MSMQSRTALAILVATGLLLSACSAGSDGADEPSAAAQGGQGTERDLLGEGSAPGAMGDGRDFGGGLSGAIAAVDDGVLQLQSADSQTAVHWTDETTVSRTVTVSVAEVTVGSCLLAIIPTADDAGGAAAAMSLSVSKAEEDGGCAAARGFPGSGGGERPQLPEGQAPPAGELPEGRAGGPGTIVFGTVTGVDGSTITVESTVQDTTTTTEVVVDASTTITSTVTADAGAIAVGLCAQVVGEDDERGGTTATALTLSDAGQDGCMAFGAPGGFGRARGPVQGSTGA